MGAKWYETFKSYILDEMNHVSNKRKTKYIAICSCGDFYACSNKKFYEYHVPAHQFTSSGKHRVQIFKETDIW
jgi:hypothetical protein